MRIINISSSKGSGGREIQLIKISEELALRGHDILIITAPNTLIHKEALRLGIKVKAFPIKKYIDIFALIRMGLMFRKYKPDIINLYFISDMWLVVPAIKCFYKKAKSVLIRSMQSSPMKDIIRTKLFKGIDKILVVSNFIKHDFLSKTNVNKNKVEVLYQGVRVEEYEKYDKIKKLRKEYNIDDKTILVGLVGRLDKAKGQDKLLQAAEEILQFEKDLKFVMIGGSEIEKGKKYKDHLEKIVIDLGLGDKVLFTDFRSDVKELLSSLDIIVCGSQEESFGMVVVEGMAAGKPLVVFNRGALGEIVENEITGYVVPYSVRGLIRGIKAIIESPYIKTRFGELGRIRAKKVFHINKTIDQIEALYVNLKNS